MLNAWIKRELIYVWTHDFWWDGLVAPRQIFWDYSLFCFAPGPSRLNSLNFHISQDLTLTYLPISIDISSYVWAFSFLQIFTILFHLLCLCCCLYSTLPSTSAYQNSTSSPNHKCIFQHVLSDIPLFISPPKIDMICLPLTQGFLNSSL